MFFFQILEDFRDRLRVCALCRSQRVRENVGAVRVGSRGGAQGVHSHWLYPTTSRPRKVGRTQHHVSDVYGVLHLQPVGNNEIFYAREKEAQTEFCGNEQLRDAVVITSERLQGVCPGQRGSPGANHHSFCPLVAIVRERAQPLCQPRRLAHNDGLFLNPLQYSKKSLHARRSDRFVCKDERGARIDALV